MGSEEVGVLRDLAKQAVSLLRRISDGEGVDGEDEADEMSVDQDFDGSDGEDVAGEGPDDEDHHEGSPVLPNVETDAERSSDVLINKLVHQTVSVNRCNSASHLSLYAT